MSNVSRLSFCNHNPYHPCMLRIFTYTIWFIYRGNGYTVIPYMDSMGKATYGATYYGYPKGVSVRGEDD